MQKSDRGKTYEAAIEWSSPENIISRYATNMVVQSTENEFIISFYEVRPPLLFGPPPEGVEPPSVVRAECVARVIVSPGRMPNFVRVLQQQLERYQTEEEEDKEGIENISEENEGEIA